MGLRERVQSKRDEILRIAARHGARNVRLFGSVARGESDENSDVDFVVSLDESRSLLDHAALLAELEELLGCNVDVAPESDLRPKVRERVLKDAIAI